MYVPCGTVEEAEKISTALVMENLAVCCNVLPNTISIYKWQGKMRKETETLLLAKVVDLKKNRAIRKVKKIHSYDIPLICFYKAESVNPVFLSWARKQ